MVNLLDAFAAGRVPLRLWNPAYSEYLFVSNDQIKGDNIIEGHDQAHRQEPRNTFHLVPVNGTGRFRIYNPAYDKWAFVSNDKKGDDRVVEAHTNPGDPRNEFELIPLPDGLFRVDNPATGRCLFVSNDKEGPDNVVEAHEMNHAGEPRNRFSIEAPEPTGYTLVEMSYETNLAEVAEMPPQQFSTIDVTNNADFENLVNQTVSDRYTETETWTSEVSTKLGVSTSIKSGLSILAEGKIGVSAEVGYAYSWGQTHTTESMIANTVPVKVPARSVVTVSYGVWLYRARVKFRGTLLVDYSGGQYRFPVEGTYEGVKCPMLRVTFGPARPL